MQKDIQSVKIAPLSIEDIDSVIKIEESAYGDHHWSRESFVGEISNELARYYALYTSDGVLAGYAGCWHILEEVHITTIAVSKEYRRRRFAEALLKRIIDDCYKEKIKYITLEVRVSNKPAINLYTKYGFSSFGTRKAYYQDNNEDALIMWTKNIFFDEFKNNYENVIAQLEGKIVVNE
ncbi:MAG: ribosomal-protein-alanine N-acetyltransferase [Cyanobacteria bacterium SIG26]|nr:ribosomal-protein-alanine N-acetyltransferase [Cyanobacteria bacterium SIG26]